jgi:hypothetical protein
MITRTPPWDPWCGYNATKGPTVVVKAVAGRAARRER